MYCRCSVRTAAGCCGPRRAPAGSRPNFTWRISHRRWSNLRIVFSRDHAPAACYPAGAKRQAGSRLRFAPGASDQEKAMSTGLDDIPRPQLLTMQIIAAALMIGVVVFLSIVLFLVYVQQGGQGQMPPGDLPIVSLVAIAMFVINT